MKKVLIILISFFFISNVSAKEVNLYLFHGDGCPHCEEEIEYLNSIENEYNYLNIIKYEVWYNEDNSTLLNNVKTSLNTNNSYVPYTVIGKYNLTGFNDNTKEKIKEYIEYCYNNDCEDIVSKVKQSNASITVDDNTTNEETNIDDTTNDEKINNVTVPVLGNIDAKSVSLPILAAVIGLVDGFNPCAMWVLIFLISFLLTTKDRKKMWILGSTFLITSAFIYMLFMMSWLTITIKLSNITIIRNIIALIACIAGLINLRSYYRMSKKDVGCEVVDNNKRKKIIDKIKTFVLEKNMLLAVIGIMALAVSVNFIELACSAGLPLLFTQVLAINNLSNLMYFIYILIYIIFFLLDDMIIFFVAMFTFKITGISNKYTKYSHLIGGIIMLIIGLLLIFKPSLIMFNL